MIKAFLIILCISQIILSQDNRVSDDELNYTFHFPNKQCNLLLTGYKNSEDSRFIYASEFYVINIQTNDTLIFFGALQNCRIDKNRSDTLFIIETKKLSFRHSSKWMEFNYLEYNLSFKSNKILIDTLLLLKVPKSIPADKLMAVKEFERAKSDIHNVSEELSYYILFLALNNDDWAKEKLFCMQEELKLDGGFAEINRKAINIYRTYNRLK
jgi:hypothetical protein